MLSVLFACLGYSVLNISQAVQKIGLARAKEKRIQGIAVWIAATVGTLASSFLMFAAVALGNASLVGAMAATGLAALAVFSHFVMKERVGVKEIAAVAVIILAAALIGLFSTDNPVFRVRLDLLVFMLSVVIVVSASCWLIFGKKGVAAGVVIGAISGSLGGFVPLFQKVATSDFGKSLSIFSLRSEAANGAWGQILSMFSNPFTVVWILLSLVSMLVLQFAYKKADAIRIIPFFTASCIVIPVVGGVMCLEERLHPLQWVGVAMILGGLILLTGKRRKPRMNADES
ncbi:MAG: hypothetical protein JXD23_13745 [Spirochaetales bacterium]|nr:hypothetical protein [Spirochaetales bacterium]